VRVTEIELIVYDAGITEIDRHEKLPASETGHKRTNNQHRSGPDQPRKERLLRQRFEQLGAESIQFFDQLIRARRYGKNEAERILGLLTTYHRQDLCAALEQASRYRACSLSSVERILAALAEPPSAFESIDDQARQHLDQVLTQDRVQPRPTADYQQLLDGDDAMMMAPMMMTRRPGMISCERGLDEESGHPCLYSGPVDEPLSSPGHTDPS
jgi:hypothetical protein